MTAVVGSWPTGTDRGALVVSPATPAAVPGARKTILFVDDEKQILDGVRNALRSQRPEWEMVFACGGPEGLAEIESRCFDVVVSDMRMPSVSGAALLTRVKALHPRTVRIVLSGETDMDTALKMVFVAHQFLSKPCPLQVLRDTIMRMCRLHDLVQSEELRAAAGDVSMLPPAPGAYVRLTEVIANPRSSMKDAASVIEQDVGLCAKVLQVVNSAFFALPRRVASISEAATLLGTLTLKNLALALDSFSRHPGLTAARAEALHRHSLLSGLFARRLMGGDRRRSDEAFVAGMLHDVGQFVGDQRSASGRVTAPVGHGQLGAYLLGIWGLPYGIVEAVAHHEAPRSVDSASFELVDVVYLADRLVEEIAPSGNPDEPSPELDLEYLAQKGISAGRLDELRADLQKLDAELTTRA